MQVARGRWIANETEEQDFLVELHDIPKSSWLYPGLTDVKLSVRSATESREVALCRYRVTHAVALDEEGGGPNRKDWLVLQTQSRRRENNEERQRIVGELYEDGSDKMLVLGPRRRPGAIGE